MNFLQTNFDKKCRICATDIFDETNGIYIFSDIFLEEKIKKYLYITINQNDELPKTICGSCFIKLEGIHKFACLALKTEENYLTYLSRKKFNEERSQEIAQTEPIPIKIEEDIQIKTKFKTSKRDVQKLTTRPYRTTKIRNARHVDHITLEQIINDKIAKNFRSQNCEIIPIQNSAIPQIQFLPTQEISILPYNDFKLGQIIKDVKLLKLIIKTLKWSDLQNPSAAVMDILIERLKTTSFRELITNKNLVKDKKIFQLLKKAVGEETFDKIQNNDNLNFDFSISKRNLENTLEPVDLSVVYDNGGIIDGKDTITQMEVRLDPAMFLPFDDEESGSRGGGESRHEEVKIFKIENPKHLTITKKVQTIEHNYMCTICPEQFVSNVQLQEHVVSHLIKSKMKQSSNTLKFPMKSNKINNKFKKKIQGKICSKIIDNKFECLICKRALSTKGNLKTHMEIHRPRIKYTCEVCDKVFKSIINLIRHREYHNQFHRCSYCDKIYKNYHDLRIHLTEHDDIQSFHKKHDHALETFNTISSGIPQ